MRTGTTFVLSLLLTAAMALPAGAASSYTAHPSARLPVHVEPSDSSPVIDKLAKNEAVRLDICTRRARWCHVIQLDGGPSGWVTGSYLVGSSALMLATPFEFSFNPLWPRGAMLHSRQ